MIKIVKNKSDEILERVPQVGNQRLTEEMQNFELKSLEMLDSQSNSLDFPNELLQRCHCPNFVCVSARERQKKRDERWREREKEEEGVGERERMRERRVNERKERERGR